MASLRDINIDIHYQGRGAYLESFLVPALKVGTCYKRLTGFFNVGSLIAVAHGLEVLLDNGGQMQLVIGMHDVSKDLLESKSEEVTSERVKVEAEARLRELIFEIGSLGDALQVKRLEVLGLMLRSGQLVVKVAKPKSLRSADIFHVKRIVIDDKEGHFVCATGSPNETTSGTLHNWEDLSTFKSWDDGTGHAALLSSRFDEIWEGREPSLEVFELSTVMTSQIVEAIEQLKSTLTLASHKELGIEAKGKFIAALKDFVPGHIFMFKGARLYPHQEFAFLKALSRWPIRALLGDEVGLGKTLELGASLSYLSKFAGVKSGLILAPKNVTRQLQEELSKKFGMEFALWDSGKKAYRDSSGRPIFPNSGAPCSATSPKWVIASSQWARGSRYRQHLFEEMESVPELLVVDEAHAARVSPPDQRTQDSLLYKALEVASVKIPHLILLTATPMQLHVSEYHGLLRLLGLPRRWKKLANFEVAIAAQAGTESNLTLNTARTLVLLENDGSVMSGSSLSGSENELDAQQVMVEALKLKSGWKARVAGFISSNPATLLTIRNTRASLEKYGYKFPQRDFSSPDTPSNVEMAAIRESLHLYLDKAYGGVEELLQEDRRAFSKGFVTSIYEQRAASSLWSLQQSLKRRHEKLDGYLGGTVTTDELDEDDLLDDTGDYEEAQNLRSKVITPSVRDAVQNEKNFIQDVIAKINSLDGGPVLGDPKIDAAISSIVQHTANSSQAIVFSRYTDTLQALLIGLASRGLFDSISFGYYTGNECWVQRFGKRQEVTKSQLQSALASGQLSFVLCSDAASEGLNLQAASTLVNVDVPWNPGRLEQRIGRIARLGQKANQVNIVNIWYPNSVEGAMYGRLLARKELYDLAVGAFPDLFAKGIREAVALHSAQSGSYSGDVLARLEEMRESTHLDGLSKLWDSKTDTRSMSSSLWERLDTSAKNIGIELSGSEGLDVRALSNLESNFEVGQPNATLIRVFNEFGTSGFKLAFDEADRVGVELGLQDLPDLLELVFGNSKRLPSSQDDHEAWMPDHKSLRLGFDLETEFTKIPPSFESVEQENIGRLRIARES